MKSIHTLVLATALLLSSAAAGQQATPQPNTPPAVKQDCTQNPNPLDKHVQVRTPPKLKRHLAKMLQSLSNKTGVSINPNDTDPSTIAKEASKPCPAAPPTPAKQ